MQNRLSLADLKAKANVVTNTSIFTGGQCDYCHEGCNKPSKCPTSNEITVPATKQ
jgi:rubrerythrin